MYSYSVHGAQGHVGVCIIRHIIGIAKIESHHKNNHWDEFL